MITAFSETFETDGNTLSGGDRYTTSITEFSARRDFFCRTDDSGADRISGRYTNSDGIWFAVGDFDGRGNATASATMEFSDIDISGLTELSFSGLFAELTPNNGRNHWDPNTQVFFEVSIDGGDFTKILQFASTSATQSNQAAALDTDFDGVGDSTILTRNFATFSTDIAGTGSTLDLRITFENLTQGNEDFHLDTLSITGTDLAPKAEDDAFTVAEGLNLFEDVLGNDTDAQDDALSIVMAGGVAPGSQINVMSAGGREGKAFFAPSGGLNFAFDQIGNFDDLEAGETDTVTISYTITDGNGRTDTADILLTIQGEANGIIGDASNDVLTGTTGTDQIIGNEGNDILDGRAGADTMDGGTGNDVFFVDNTGDTVIEASGEGYDRVSTSITYTLANNVEMGSLLGSDDLDLTGNVENNWLNGNAGGNALNGLSGNDRLHGGAGNDALTGGEGNDNLYGEAGLDTFIFADGDGLDVIRDFEAGETMDLSATSADSFDDLTLTDISSGAMVDYGSGKIILAGMTIAEVGADDFIF